MIYWSWPLTLQALLAFPAAVFLLTLVLMYENWYAWCKYSYTIKIGTLFTLMCQTLSHTVISLSLCPQMPLISFSHTDWASTQLSVHQILRPWHCHRPTWVFISWFSVKTWNANTLQQLHKQPTSPRNWLYSCLRWAARACCFWAELVLVRGRPCSCVCGLASYIMKCLSVNQTAPYIRTGESKKTSLKSLSRYLH